MASDWDLSESQLYGVYELECGRLAARAASPRAYSVLEVVRDAELSGVTNRERAELIRSIGRCWRR